MESKEMTPPVIRIERRWKKERYTIGRLYVDGVYWFNTLEDTDRGLHSGMGVVTIKAKKVACETAIPRGQYEVTLVATVSFRDRAWAKKYDGLVPRLHKVKGFDGILIHPGNTAADTRGCILPGLNTKVGQLTSSASCYYRLMDEVFMPAHNAGQTVILDII